MRVSIAKDIITLAWHTIHMQIIPQHTASSPESMAAPKETTRSKPRTASRLLCGARLPTEPDSNCQMLQASSAPVIVSGGKCVMCAANNVPLPLQHEWLPPTRPARSAKSVELLEDFKTIGAFPPGPAGPTCTTAPAQPGQDQLPFAAQYERAHQPSRSSRVRPRLRCRCACKRPAYAELCRKSCRANARTADRLSTFRFAKLSESASRLAHRLVVR